MQRYAIAMSCLRAVNSQVTIGNIFYLFEGLLAPTYLKQILVIYEEITLFRIVYLIGSSELIVEENFTYGSYLYVCRKGIHKIGIIEEKSIWKY